MVTANSVTILESIGTGNSVTCMGMVAMWKVFFYKYRMDAAAEHYVAEVVICKYSYPF